MARGVMASKILVDKLTLSRLRKEIMPSTLLLIPLDFLNFLRPWKIYTLVHTRFLSAFWENRGKMRQKTCVAQPFLGDTENYVDKYLTIYVKPQANVLLVSISNGHRKDWPIKKWQILSLAILQPFLVTFLPTTYYLSQNWGADGHFEGLNVSKSQLDQKLQHKSQMILTTVFFNLEEKINKFKFQ